MELIKDIVSYYNIEIICGLIISLLVVIILYIIAEFRISRITDKYNNLVKNVDGVNLEEMMNECLNEVNEIKIDNARLENKYDDLNKRFKFAIQKIGFIRYNAFPDMGSELSFSIALLDSNLNGVIITNIYSRDYSNSYAKSVEGGKSKYPLSVEEMQAIDRAIKGEQNING
jgi:hypothetical protein